MTKGLGELVRDRATRPSSSRSESDDCLASPAEGDSGGPLAREELFAGWRLFFERTGGERPGGLLIEDAQYADTGLLDFVDHLVDWTRDLPMLC